MVWLSSTRSVGPKHMKGISPCSRCTAAPPGVKVQFQFVQTELMTCFRSSKGTGKSGFAWTFFTAISNWRFCFSVKFKKSKFVCKPDVHMDEGGKPNITQRKTLVLIELQNLQAQIRRTPTDNKRNCLSEQKCCHHSINHSRNLFAI